MATEIARRLFTVDEYYRMAEAGILGPDDRVELIEGEIVTMPPIGSPHNSVVARLNATLSHALSVSAGIVFVQGPIRLDDRSEPQPDLVVARSRPDFYAGGHPRPEDVLLLIEVSDTTLAYDRGVKLPLYARAGIREVWIVDIGGEAVEVHRQPGAGGYASSRVAHRGETVSPLAFPDLSLAVADILG